MFSKSNAPKGPAAPRPPASDAPMSEAVPRTTPRVAASVLGAGFLFEGTISGDAELSIEGVVKGDVHVARLLVGEQATVEGQIRAEQVEVRGRVIGDIQAQAVKLTESAYVQGDISQGQLSIDVGAYFAGHCQHFRHTVPAGEAQPEASSAQVVDLDAARS